MISKVHFSLILFAFHYTEGVGTDHIIGTTLPHSSFGEPDCCGCLNGRVLGDSAEILCNECGTVVRMLPADKLRQAFTEMELTLDLCSSLCPHCGATNLFPGFSQILAFACQECGQAV